MSIIDEQKQHLKMHSCEKLKKNIEHINDQLHMNILKVHKVCNKPSSKRWQKLTAKHS